MSKKLRTHLLRLLEEHARTGSTKFKQDTGLAQATGHPVAEIRRQLDMLEVQHLITSANSSNRHNARISPRGSLFLEELEETLITETTEAAGSTTSVKRSYYEDFFRDPHVGEGLLRLGHEGVACRNIRIALRNFGYSVGSGDGFDADLENGIVSFQKEYKHNVVDGQVGPGTRARLARVLLEQVGENAFIRMEDPAPLPPKKLRVFLCHSSSDKDTVRQLYRQLRREGLDPWLDEEKLLPGQNWRVEIEQAVRSAHVIVVCLSKTSVNKEGFVQREISVALDTAEEKPVGTIFVIPARLEDCMVPQRLRQYHWVDLFVDKGFERLLAAFRRRAAGISDNEVS